VINNSNDKMTNCKDIMVVYLRIRAKFFLLAKKKIRTFENVKSVVVCVFRIIEFTSGSRQRLTTILRNVKIPRNTPQPFFLGVTSNVQCIKVLKSPYFVDDFRFVKTEDAV